MYPPILLFASLLALPSVLAHPQYPEYGPGGHDEDDEPLPSSSTSSPAAAPTNPTMPTTPQSNSTLLYTGDAFCASSMCVGALVNGSTVQYTMQSRGAASLGWMALGFGTEMDNSAMVIMWPKSDGTFVLSQRSTSGHDMPTVDARPPFSATALSTLSTTNSSRPKVVFSTPLTSSGKQNVIYAFGTANPGGAADARLVQHIDYGTGTLDLGGALVASSRNPTNPVSTGFSASNPMSTNGTDTGGGSIPMLPFQKMLVAHGVLTAIGFLFLLPFGALVARYFRTSTPKWYTAHWVFQFALCCPFIAIGILLGIIGVHQAEAPHFDDDHKKWGIIIGIVYLLQLGLGALVHWVKPKSAGPALRRPWHNFVHVALGLLIIGVSFHQVRDGYNEEWPETTGRAKPAHGLDVAFWVWVILMPVLYLAGLFFVRKQFEQEKESHRKKLSSPSGEYMLSSRAPPQPYVRANY